MILTSLLVAVLLLTTVAIPVDAIACGSRTCLTGEQCCTDNVMGPTCYSSVDHTCAATEGSSGFRLCGLNEGACGTACYNKGSYFCCNGQVQQSGQACGSTTTAPTSAPTTRVATTASPTGLACGSRTCLVGERCCNDFVMGATCYNSDGYSCVATNQSSGAAGSRLCGRNLGACGSVCFDPTNYQCCNGQLQQNGQSCSVTTSSPSSPPTNAPTSTVTQPPVRNNCPGAARTAGVNCSNANLCCGANTITPSCLPADGSKTCCVHFVASTQCNPNEVCGGSGGPGASSAAICGPAGTTFCDKGTGQGAFCTTQQPTCCGYPSGFGFCCPAGCACNNNYVNCSCPQTTSAPSTTAPVSCGGRTCFVDGDRCCNDILNGPTCYSPASYQCAATNYPSTGAPGSLLCANNQGACGTVCYDKNNYYCCNNRIQQNGQPCPA